MEFPNWKVDGQNTAFFCVRTLRLVNDMLIHNSNLFCHSTFLQMNRLQQQKKILAVVQIKVSLNTTPDFLFFGPYNDTRLQLGRTLEGKIQATNPLSHQETQVYP